MASRQITMAVSIGPSLQLMRECPTVTSETRPIIAWTLPEGLLQRRYNVRVQSEQEGQTGLYIAGINTTSDQYHQWPYGIPMTDNFDGLISVEIAVSESAQYDDPFEFTSGKHYFVLDRVSENLYNTTSAYLQWSNSADVDIQQARLYHLMVSTDPTFVHENQTVIDVEVPESQSSQYSKHLCSIQPGNTYFWKVRAYDGYDFGPWTVVNGFINHLNFPPEVVIISAIPLNNIYGDVEIEFSLSDLDVEPVYIVATYTGGSTGLTPKNMSLINPLVHVANGTRKIIWRSGRDEPLKSANNYMITFLPYDSSGYGQFVLYGPITIDNSTVGADSGGIGSVDIDFPATTNVAKIVYENTPFTQIPVEGYSTVSASGYGGHTFCTLTPYIIGWKNFSMGVLRNVDDVHGYGVNSGLWWLERNRFTHGMTIDPNFTEKSTSLDLESSEPDFTPRTDWVSSTGYHKELDETSFQRAGRIFGYIKFIRSRYYDRVPCTSCGGKGWRVQDLIAAPASGWYIRTPCVACSGLQFSNTPLHPHPQTNDLSIVTEPYYEPVENWFAPLDKSSLYMFDAVTPSIEKDFRFIYGSRAKVDTIFPPEELPGVAGTTYQTDAPSLVNNRWTASGVYPFLNFETNFGIKTYTNYDPPYKDWAVQGSLLQTAIKTRSYLPMTGSIVGNKRSYVTGYGPDEARGFIQRPTPTHRWEKGVYPLTCNLTSIEPLEPLKIVYLQGSWDAFNTIHWQATISSVSRIHLQVAKFFEDGTHTEYVDVIAEGAEFIADANAYLVVPNVWHTYWDTATRQLLDSGYDYKLRIRQFDIISKTFSQWVYSAKFIVSHTATNPANIISTRYDSWSKILYITFRLDDSNKDSYDITKVWYSLNDGSFVEIGRENIIGNRHELSSDKDGIRLDGSPANVHVIGWRTGSLQLVPSNKYRVRLETLPTIIVNGATVPIFKWAMYDNPKLRKAELTLMEMQGYLQQYWYNNETDELEVMDPPQYVPGTIDRLQGEIYDIELYPPPSGKYNFYTPPNNTGTLTDLDGYWEWMSTKISEDKTRSQVLMEKADALDELRNTEVPKWMNIRNMAEMETRKGLIDQGFYCNGFNGNDPNNGIFRFRVESIPTGDAAFDNQGNYSPTYTSRLEVYYRVQLDFLQSFDSQLYGKPLRDIMFNADGSRIQGGNRRTGTTRLTSNGVYDPSYDATIRTWHNFGDNTGQPWDSGTQASSVQSITGTQAQITAPSYNDPVTTYTMPKTDFPGEHTDYFINNSFNSVDDIKPSGLASFNTRYNWRVAAYNLVSGPTREVVRPTIDACSYYSSLQLISIDFSLYGDEEIQEASLAYLYYSIAPFASGWVNVEQVSFPTDRPIGYEAQSDDNPVVWIPYGLNRSRPSVFITEDHQFYMWYSKPNSFSQPTILHSRGKAWNCFGEYEQVFPKEVNKPVNQYSGSTAIYAPMVIRVNGLYCMYSTLYGSFNRLARSTSVDATTWSSPAFLTGVQNGAYSPCCVHDGNIYHMWFCKVASGVSEIYYATSVNGIDFSMANTGNPVLTHTYNLNTPWVILTETGFKMYYTKYDISNVSKIYSVTSSDGIVWSNDTLEISTDNSSNPCVVNDVCYGNSVKRMYYNVQSGNNIRIYTAVYDLTSWSSLDVNYNGVYGDKYNLDCSLFGKQYSMSLALNSWQFPSDLKNVTDVNSVRFRLVFVNDATTRSFRVQSDWIDSSNADEYDATISPASFNYNDEMKNFDFSE